MVWSISESRTFKRCQRQWYFKNFVANALAKDPLRHEAYLLSKLQSVSAWRGNVVDSVISEFVLPSLRKKQLPKLPEAIRNAKSLYDQQVAFALRHPLHDPQMSPSKAGTKFAAFYCMEYGGSVAQSELDQAWDDIQAALTNFYEMTEVHSELLSATYVIAQRALSFSHSGSSVRAVPDAIAFFRQGPPLILDWKVHSFGLQEAWTQLATYAIALTRCTPHKDFPSNFSQLNPHDVRLAEVQLLKKQVRRYELSEDDIDRADAYIAESVTLMEWATEGKTGKELQPTDLPPAVSPDVCQRCSFRKLCWSAE